ncbi:MAG: M48 family metallopeptidase [Bacteriovoracaceae bacterium]|nr:M48 family metallopeptidase [Bacteriovoracaceae bacterium]
MKTTDIFSNIFVIFYSIKTLTELYLNSRNIRHIKTKSGKVPYEFKERVPLTDHQKAAKYNSVKLGFGQFSLFYHTAILYFWLPFGGVNLLNAEIAKLTPNTLLQGLIFFSSFFLISTLLSLPERLFSTFVIEEKFGFNKTTGKIFTIDLFKQLLLAAILGLPLLTGILYVYENAGVYWWVYTWLLMTAFQFFVIWAYPTFIAPFFNKFAPLKSDELILKINALMEKTGFESNGLFVMDASTRTSHGNAYFSGLGKKKRIVFFDTLLKTLTPDEVTAVLAHELGHFKKKHIIKSLTISLFLSLVGLGILGYVSQHEWFYSIHFVNTQSSYMALFLFSLIIPVYTFFFTPFSSWFSRKNEYEADDFAAIHTNPKHLIESLVKLYRDNASSLTPDPLYSKFYHSHPAAIDRITNLKTKLISHESVL